MSPAKVLALLLLMFGTLFLAFQYQQRASTKLGENFLTPLPKPSGEVAAIQTEISSPSPLPTSAQTPKPIIWATPPSSPKIQSQSSNIDSFLYSNSQVKSQTTSSAQLESNDSPDSITNWYKNKLNSLGFNATSFVTTNSNNNVLNKLVVARNNQQVRVEIKKNASDSKTTISIEMH